METDRDADFFVVAEQVIDEDDGFTNADLINDLFDTLDETYDFSTFGNPGLRCSDAEIILEPSRRIDDLDINVFVKEINDQLEWEIDVPETYEGSTSISSGKREISRLLKYKVRHEYVSESLSSGSTDQPLSSFLPKMDDGYDNLTPDITLFDKNGMIHVVEIATSRSPYLNLGRRFLEQKLFKYHDALDIRSDNHIVTYTVIVVTPRHVISNIKLPIRLVNDLSDRMHIAILLENEAEAIGIKIQQDLSETVRSLYESVIREELEKVSNAPLTKGNTRLMIDDEFIQDSLKDPDAEDVKKCFIMSRVRTIERMKNKRDVNCDCQIKNYISSLSRDEKKKFRQDQKPVTIFPLVTPEITSDTQVPKRHVVKFQGEQESLSDIWNEALEKVTKPNSFIEENKAQLKKEAMEKDRKKVELMIKNRKLKRRKYHRVEVKAVHKTKTKRFLNKDGIFRKANSHTPEVLSRKLKQKSQFSWNTKTNDIDEFLNDTSLLDCSRHKTDPSQDAILDLTNLAAALSKNSKENVEIFQEWMGTKLYQSLDLISNIAFELTIAAKQNTSSTEFILKKLRFHNVYVLIKPTNSKSHIFYSLLFPDLKKEDILNQSPFRKLHYGSRGMATDFCSVRLDKIENQASISSCLLSLISFWSDFYNMDSMSPESFKTNIAALRMLLFSILVRLEDKAETEESITLTRYMYMEIFKSNWTYMPPDPFKMLSKFSTNPRSRLNLWVIKKIIEGFSIMMSNMPKRVSPTSDVILEEGEDSLPGDEWVGLINVFNTSNLRTATAAVNLMYIGYLKNKNQTPQANSDWNMLKKILEEEFAVDMNAERKMKGGLTYEDVPNRKEFSLNNISYGVSLLEKRMRGRRGHLWKKTLGDEVVRKLSEHLTNEIATLKASSSYKHGEADAKSKKDDPEIIIRIKVIEAIATKLGLFDLNPFINLNKFIEIIRNSTQGVIADLFQKNQHGGLREIYVLDVVSRVIQLFIETISRTICSHFDEETLTHPQNKLKLLDMHKTKSHKVSSKKSTFYFDLCSSSDKTRWNQNFQIRALSIPLFRMMPKEFHPAIKTCLNFWCNKKIKIPPAVCQLLMNNIPLSCPVYTELKSKFLRLKHNSKNNLGLSSPKSSFVTVSTGMMQGILHYTSSLLHLSYLYASKSLTLSFIKFTNPDAHATMTQVCSSDDSATILTIHSEVDMARMKPVHTTLFYEAEVLLHTLTEYCKYFCMLESIKSTIALPDYVEFNSEFLFKNTIAIPTIKYVTASVNLTESESMMDRFYTFYNLLSDLYSTGFPAIKTSFCQIAQAHLHYKTMGSYTNGLFLDYIEDLVKLPSPIYGFFLLDTELFPGVMGFQFSRWLSIQSCELLRNAVNVINYGELEANSDGSIHESLTIKHGDSKRWKRMLHCIHKSNVSSHYNTKIKLFSGANESKMEREHEERMKLIEDNYPLMYRFPKDTSELKIKLLIKASMPGIAKSLSKGVPFIQSVQMSMYAINTHAFTLTRFRIKEDSKSANLERVKETRKLSLLLALSNKIKECEDTTFSQEDHESMMSLMFPMSERYREALDVIRVYENRDEFQTHRMRQRKNFIIIQPKTQSLPMSFLQVVGSLWFGFPTRTSNNIYKRCLESYRVMYPWLKDDIHETLQQSPFGTMIELYSFISSNRDKIRKFNRNGPSIQSNRFVGQLHQLVKKSFKRNVILISTNKNLSRYQKRDVIKSKMSLSLTIPIKRIRDRKVYEVMAEVSSRGNVEDELPYMQRRDKILTLISLYSNNNLTKDTLVDQIRSLQTGFLMSYTNPQKPKIIDGEKRWCGPGTCVFESEGLFFKFFLNDDYIIKIETNSWRKMRSNPEILKDAMRKVRSKFCPENTSMDNCIARFDGSSFQSPLGRGIPIMEDISYEYVSFDMKDFNIRISLESISIVSRIREEEIVILEYKTNARDLNLQITNYQETDSLWDHWVEQSSLAAGVAYDELSSIENFMGSSKVSEVEKLNLSNWVKSTLSNRVRYLGAGHVVNSQMLSSVTDTPAELEWDDDEYTEFYMDIGYDDIDMDIIDMVDVKEKELAIDLIKTRRGLEAYEEIDVEDCELEDVFREMLEPDEMDSPLAMIFSNWSASTKIGEVSTINRDTFSYLFMHPLWDNFIQDVSSMDQTFFTKVLQGIIPVVDPELGRRIMRIMRIQEKKTELNITQRFSRVKEGRQVDWWE